jgi:hypothetical protein
MNQYLKAALIIFAIGGLLFVAVPAVIFGVMWHDMWSTASHLGFNHH